MFNPENRLEESLVAAASDPASRPDFYRQLIASDIFVIDDAPAPAAHGTHTLEAGHTLNIRPMEMNGESYLPVFSSVTRLQAAIREEVSYLGMNALEFMKITSGARLLLNPGSDYGKELLPEEVASIIDGSIWTPAESYTVPRETKILIGQPARYPDELVAVLTRVFEKNKSVERAFVAHFHNPATDEKPHTLVAIDAKDDWDDVVGQAGIAANGVTIPDPPVDFVQLRGSSLESYFKTVTPFYRRRLLGFF
jgi:hypothetical protein